MKSNITVAQLINNELHNSQIKVINCVSLQTQLRAQRIAVNNCSLLCSQLNLHLNASSNCQFLPIKIQARHQDPVYNRLEETV